MKQKQWLLVGLTAALAVSPSAMADQISEGFSSVPGLTGAGWVVVNNSSPGPGSTSWFQGNTAVFSAQAGATNSYAGANFNAAPFTGDVSLWLITPVVTLADGVKLTFFTRTESPQVAIDTLQVRMSTNGASTNVGATSTSVGDFTTQVAVVNTTNTVTGYPSAWTQVNVTITGLPVPVLGRLAFRYLVTDTSTNGDYIGIDSVTVSDAPVDLSISKNHIGNFIQGQLAANYTITVSNSAITGPSAGPITVTDVLPAGLTAVAVSGTGWTCTLAPLSCTTNAVVAAGASLPPITLTVSVATNATSTVVNTATVSGGGDLTPANNTATDTATVDPLGFLIRYASNLTSTDSVINLTNTGANGASLNGPGFGGSAGNICANVYAFSPDEQLVACCSCLITPNGLASLSVTRDLISNTLTGVRPSSIVVKVVNTAAGAAFTGTSCTNSAALAGTASFPTANGMLAFGTTAHANGGSTAITETPFSRATLSPAELASITGRCTNIIGNGSTFGICRSCSAGGLTQTQF